MMDFGKMVCHMDQVYVTILMVLNMTVSGEMDSLMAKEGKLTQMAPGMMEAGNMVKPKDLGRNNLKTRPFSLVNGEEVK